MTLSSFHQAALSLAAGASLVATPAWGGEGHDHGEAPAAVTSAASPRFTAVSEAFELVGVLDGKQLTLYLDRYADNSPVKGAQLELEIGNVKVPLESDAQGGYTATLAETPKPGVIPVTATVIAGAETDLLAGELDVHEDEHADESVSDSGWQALAAWGGGALLAIVAVVWTGRRVRMDRSARAGGAA